MSRRSFWAWGLEQDEPTEQQVREAAARLSQRYGVEVEPVMPPRAEDLRLRAPRISPPSSLAAICDTSDHDRAVHTYGRSFRDRIRAYNLQFPNPPDVVAHPTNGGGGYGGTGLVLVVRATPPSLTAAAAQPSRASSLRTGTMAS